MSGIVILAGTPGAGKTSILNEIKNTSGKKYKIVGIGTEMLNIANKGNGKGMKVADRDMIRSLDSDEIAKLRFRACSSINKMTGNIVLDTHASIKKGNRYVLGFFIDELKKFKNLKALVYIDSRAHDIIFRRAKDLGRKREVESIEELDTQREINIGLISAYAAHMHIPIYIIRNEQDHLDAAVKETHKALNNIFGV
jgi:adenylate kinase